MADSIARRNFITSSIILAAAAGAGTAAAPATGKKQEFYELRVYRVKNRDKQKLVSGYLEKALVPGLNRLGINRVGVFTLMESADDPALFMLIPYPTLEHFAGLNPKLEADSAYMAASKDFLAEPKEDPAFQRIESKFFKAFSGMPVIELPAQTRAKKARIFELRTYESHNPERAARKVEMFNTGETQVMREAEMAPVFFGEALIGADVPELTYMLSADNMAAHEEHWKAFQAHPEWNRMKGLAKYKDTVSKITKWFLVPTAYSQI
ncbi:MAG: NIPSNAP family protein [Acidobacteriota bacterium]